jgi:hypothetical protein
MEISFNKIEVDESNFKIEINIEPTKVEQTRVIMTINQAKLFSKIDEAFRNSRQEHSIKHENWFYSKHNTKQIL